MSCFYCRGKHVDGANHSAAARVLRRRLRKMTNHEAARFYGKKSADTIAGWRRKLGMPPGSGREPKVLRELLSEYRGELRVKSLHSYITEEYGAISYRQVQRIVAKLKRGFLTSAPDLRQTDVRGGHHGQASLQIREGEADDPGHAEGFVPQAQAPQEVAPRARRGTRHGTSQGLQAREAQAPAWPSSLPPQGAVDRATAPGGAP